MRRSIRFFLLLALSLIFILSVAGIGVSANTDVTNAEDPQLRITACTLSFDDSVYIMYALPIDSAADADVKMLYFTEPQSSLAEYNYANAKYCENPIDVQDVFGEECYVYKNKHMNAKNMTDVVYARAYAKVGETEYYSNLVKYSILEYAHNTLAGIPAQAPSAEQLKLKNLLETMLLYGAASQEYFEYNVDRLATDTFYKVTVLGGVFAADACTKGMHKENEFITLTAYPDESNPVVVWYDSNYRLVGEGETVTVAVGDADCTYTAHRSKRSIDGVTFGSATYVYDGTAKSLFVEGDIPQGVSVSYTNNVATNAGRYAAKATLSGAGYETLVLEADLVIQKAEMTGVYLNSKTYEYKAGKTFSLSVTGTLPDGAEVVYTNNSASKVGTYNVTATISADNYETLVLTAKLVVKVSSTGGIVTPEHTFG